MHGPRHGPSAIARRRHLPEAAQSRTASLLRFHWRCFTPKRQVSLIRLASAPLQAHPRAARQQHRPRGPPPPHSAPLAHARSRRRRRVPIAPPPPRRPAADRGTRAQREREREQPPSPASRPLVGRRPRGPQSSPSSSRVGLFSASRARLALLRAPGSPTLGGTYSRSKSVLPSRVERIPDDPTPLLSSPCVRVIGSRRRCRALQPC